VAVSLGPHYATASYPHPSMSHLPSAVAGVAQRVAGDVPKPDRKLLRKLSNFIDEWLELNITPLEADFDVSFDVWIESTHYPAWRKKELRDLYLAGIDDPPDFTHWKFIKCKAFVKDENYNRPKFNRGIYSRVDPFKVFSGPIFRAIEGLVYSKSEFIKHVPVLQRAEHLRCVLRGGESSLLKFMETDYTSFEKHFTREILAATEFKLYKHCVKRLPDGPEWYRTITKVLGGKNRITFRDFSVDIQASRMSGEMNTSLGNGFVNLMLFLFIMKEMGNENYNCAVEGDDLIASFEGDYPTEKMYADLGFTIKIEPKNSLSEASFCGLIFDDEELISITDPIKVILNLPWSNARFTNAGTRLRKRLLKSKALSAYHQYRGVPIVQSFAKNILRLLGNVRTDHRMLNNYRHQQLLELMMHGMPPEIEVGPLTRELMHKKFGISPKSQIELEKYFDSMTELDQWHHPVIDDHCGKMKHKTFIGDLSYIDLHEMYVSTDRNPVLPVAVNFQFF